MGGGAIIIFPHFYPFSKGQRGRNTRSSSTVRYEVMKLCPRSVLWDSNDFSLGVVGQFRACMP